MKAVILDMDGVIIDSEPMHFKLERELLEELGGRISNQDHERFVGTTDHHIWSTFKDQFNIGMEIDEIIAIKKERFLKVIDDIALVPNFTSFLNMVYGEGLKIGLASSNNREVVDRVIESFGLSGYLDFYISGEEVSQGKPNPEIFLKCAEKLQVKPENCLVIEDAKAGVEAGKSAGMVTIGLKNPNSGDQDLSKADLVIGDLSELTMEKLNGLFK